MATSVPRSERWRQRSLPPRVLVGPPSPVGRASVPHALLARPTAVAVPGAPAPAVRAPRSRQRASATRAARVSWLAVLLAAALPLVLWSGDVGTVAGDFHLNLGYLVAGWGAYVLLVVGVARLTLAARAAGRGHDVRARRHVSSGLPLYALGLLLAAQVATLLR
ncbi:MAG TPA: hypothetical protein VHX88_19320 [Solirubrobacteraceae bacterium]|jgi:hypothetical protein|nr:hypothetical protein [Solirubrobacteraceae bacterium]